MAIYHHLERDPLRHVPVEAEAQQHMGAGAGVAQLGGSLVESHTSNAEYEHI